MLKFLLWTIGITIGSLIFAALQRRFAPETLANGFMDLEKGKEIAPSVFDKKKESKEEQKPTGR